MTLVASVFHPYSRSESLRSDRSTGDRHRQKVRELIRNNIVGLVAEESILGRRKDKIIKVPIRGVKEHRFTYGENSPEVGQGHGDSHAGQVVGKEQNGKPGAGQGVVSDQPGVDCYETDITLEEMIEVLFEELELPDMERKVLRQVMSERTTKRHGRHQVGIRPRLDKKRTALSRIRRRVLARRRTEPEGKEEARHSASPHRREREEGNGEQRFPFHKDDMVYRHRETEVRPDSKAVVICIMDVSGSLDTMKKYLARSFFFLLYQFVCASYRKVELVFVAHHTEGREVSEEEFFHKGESGGAVISSGYKKALEIIQARYHPSLWNIYAFHCSDGDNWESDNPAMLKTALELCDICNLFGYGEIKPLDPQHYENSLFELFRHLKADNFKLVSIQQREEVWAALMAFLA